jgi:hypothetical protein
VERESGSIERCAAKELSEVANLLEEDKVSLAELRNMAPIPASVYNV